MNACPFDYCRNVDFISRARLTCLTTIYTQLTSLWAENCIVGPIRLELRSARFEDGNLQKQS